MIGRGKAVEPDCDRCDAPLSVHVDDAQRWVGCPYPSIRRCAYQGCTETVIADARLWLCTEHLPGHLR